MVVQTAVAVERADSARVLHSALPQEPNTRLLSVLVATLGRAQETVAQRPTDQRATIPYLAPSPQRAVAVDRLLINLRIAD